MFGCSTSCPKCKHEFKCCSTSSPCFPQIARRASHCLSGGGLITSTLEPPSSTSAVTSPCQSPQVSPSMSLAFVMPQPTFPLLPAPPPTDAAKPEIELERLSDTVRVLRLSGWYYEGLTYQQSHELLKNTSVGTFLVRNSSDPDFLFSLSVQTDRGPTSVRLCYLQGYFRLNAQPHLQTAMPMFPSVMELVEHYVNQSKLCRNSSQVWVDPQGKWYSSIVLDKPLVKNCQPHSLKHLARMAINKALRLSTMPKIALLSSPHQRLELPKSLTVYLEEYPYSL